VFSLSKTIWICEECEATWTDKAEISIKQFLDFNNYLQSHGLKGEWSEVEQIGYD
jgi:hypothetical protein